MLSLRVIPEFEIAASYFLGSFLSRKGVSKMHVGITLLKVSFKDLLLSKYMAGPLTQISKWYDSHYMK